jgi:hypothetical protein
MDRFEYVMVLVSIILGLGITYLLRGIGGIIDRRTGFGPPLRLSAAHSIWLAFLFWWMVNFWWWEFRFFELETEWSLGLYLFLILYSVSLFLLAVILIPSTWDHVNDVGEFFLARRAWFYSFFLLVIALDGADSYLKGGWSYILELGPLTWALWVGMVIVCGVGLRTRKLRVHTVGAALLLALQVIQGFVALPRLGF